MGALFSYPQSAAFGRVLPKSKIYERAAPRNAVRELFVRQVEQIVWQYKLAPETVNLSGTDTVPEIQIFRIVLKGDDLNMDVLRCIDQAIPFPILFEVDSGKKARTIGAYKRPSEADFAKWVVSEHFAGPWEKADAQRSPLPVALNLESLYAQLLSVLMPHPARKGESLRERVERMELIRVRERELEKCTARLAKEKQFNHKVGINAEARALRQELECLIQ